MSKIHLANRAIATTLYVIDFLISILILGIFSWYLAVLSRREGAVIPNWVKAVEGLSGSAALYSVFAILLTCFFGGITVFAFLGILLDLLFCVAFIVIAILTRAGSYNCKNTFDNSPIGRGRHTACRLQQVAFAVSIIGAFVFAISAASQFALSRSTKREKRYGPSPSNNYTSGTGTNWRSFGRKKNRKVPMNDTELAHNSAL